MITKEVTQIKRKRDLNGGPLRRSAKRASRRGYSFMCRTELCEVTTFRFLGIPLYRKTELLKFF